MTITQIIGGPHTLDDRFGTQLCTGPTVCVGDAGSPIVETQKGGLKVLIGFAAWFVEPCGTPGYPSVYTKNSRFMAWITENAV